MERTYPPPPRCCGQTYDDVFFRRIGPVNASSEKSYSYVRIGCEQSARDFVNGHKKICAIHALKCKFKDCQGKSVAKGLCIKHYTRARPRGDPSKYISIDLSNSNLQKNCAG